MASMRIGGDDMRLIDADALDWERIEHEHGARHEAVVDCEQMVEKAPTIDPVRHGRWIVGTKRKFIDLENADRQYKELGYPHRSYANMICSCCRMTTMVDDTIKYDYCPHCGAKMDEEK